MDKLVLGTILPKILAVSMTGLVLATGASEVVNNVDVVETTTEQVVEEVVEEPSVAGEPEEPAEEVTSVVQNGVQINSDRTITRQNKGTEESPNYAIMDDDHMPMDQDHFVTQREFETAYMGWCPKDVPDGMFQNKLDPSVALGISGSLTAAEWFTPRGQVLSVWNTYAQGLTLGANYKFIEVERIGVNLPPNYGSFYRRGQYISSGSGWWFSLNWASRTISVVCDDDGCVEATSAQRAEMESMARWMTEYLRDLDNRYNAKCGL